MKPRFLLPLLCLSLTSFAQDSVFQLKDYRYRTPGFKALALNVNFSGNYSNANVNDVNTERRNSTSLGPVSADYYRIRSTDKRFLQTNISVAADYGSSSLKEASDRWDRNEWGGRFAWQINSRHYRNKQWFLEWGNDLRASVGTNKYKTTSFHLQGKQLSASNTFTIGVGKGRIEWVQDAQMAVYILEDLAGQNLLNRNPTAEETNAFAQLVTDIRNRRVFDSRRRRIYELTRIDSFLKSSGLVTQTDIRHFTTVNDNWAFAINPFRQSGKSWFVRLKPGVRVDKSRSTNKLLPQPAYSKTTFTTLNLSPEIGYETYRPVSLKWQRNFQVRVSYLGQRYYQKSEEVNSGSQSVVKNELNGGSMNLNATYGVGYYPNTRTQITAEAGLSASYSNGKAWGVSPSLTFSANYFIGYRTYLNAYVSSGYYHNRFEDLFIASKANRFSSDFSIRLSHFLF